MRAAVTQLSSSDVASTRIDALHVAAFTIPTEGEEQDGTLTWHHTTLVLVEVAAAGVVGVGYTYASRAAAIVIEDVLRPVVLGRCAMDVQGSWEGMRRAVRNLGQRGLVSMAISAVDTTLWDLKARLLDVPLVSLLGGVRDTLPVYGSGGFTNYTNDQLQRQLVGWTDCGIRMVKMKVGRDPVADRTRVAAAREAIGGDVALFVDANGAYAPQTALAQAQCWKAFGVTWFEEPVSSDDVAGLRFVRDRSPAGMTIAAGEYAFDALSFRRLLDAGAVDTLQADATRCGGITGFLAAGTLCDTYAVPLSSHCAPALHLHPGCAVGAMAHAEYFFDHVRIEEMLFEGVARPDASGTLVPDRSRAGNGLRFNWDAAAPYRVRP